jgi:peptidoglycan lytic transglycosylase G
VRIPNALRAWRWALVAGVVIISAAAAGTYFWWGYERPFSMSQPSVEVRIAKGASARTIAHAIRAAGADINELEFIAVARASGATQSLRAGRYAIESGMSMRLLVDMIRRGEVVKERLTVLEGTTFHDLREQFDATPELQHQTAKLNDAELLRAIGATEKDPEGLFAPDTYVFDPGSSDLDLYRRAYRMQQERIARAWDARAPDLPYHNPYEALIMASIVEKETGQDFERRRVAGVFVNRQRLGMPLQTDPSVIYGLGDRFDGRLHRKDLNADGPYNTYLRVGLPPTPIALPGQAAIEAALNPETTHDLYFVARGDGTSEFSATLAAHQRAVERFQKTGAKSAAHDARRPVGD